MKVLFLSFYFPPDLCAGSFRAESLVKVLVDHMPIDSHVDVLTTMPNRYASFSVEAKKEESFCGYTIHRVAVPKHKSGMIDQSLSFIAYLRGCLRFAKGKKYDLIIATSSRLMTSFLGAFLSQRKKIPVYQDVRDIYTDVIGSILDAKVSFFVMPLFKAIERYSFSRANAINLVSRGFEDYIKGKFPNKKLSFFTNGIDDEFVNMKLCNSFEENKKIQVLYAGNVGEGQGLHLIIPQLATKMKDEMDFTIIGDGGRMQELRNAIALQKCENVFLHSPVTRKNLISEYQKADVLFMHLNKQDSFRRVLPSKMFEYAAMGKPIWAGVSGYAAQFVAEEIENAQSFTPCNAKEAIFCYNDLEMKLTPRKGFIDKYSRVNIMTEMSKDILSLTMAGRSIT